MSIFRKVFSRNKTPTLEDAVFGSMSFQPSHGIDIWCHLPSSESDCMVVAVAPLTGPTDRQKRFYARLQSELPARLTECRAFIASQGVAPAGLADMRIYAVEVGPDRELDEGVFAIELSNSEANEIHRVRFANGHPSAYGVDD